jgi:RND family efflux transporter MFP subunit
MIRFPFRTLALASVLTLAACSSSDEAATAEAVDEAPAARTIRVETLVLSPTPFDDIIEISGTVEASDDAVLSAQSSGTVTTLVPLGQRVAQGAVVAQLDASLARAALGQAQAVLEQAQAQAAFAEDNFTRQQGLYADSIISALEFENVRTQRASANASVAQARAAVQQAEAQLRFTRVVAPFAGVVEEHFAERGEQVAPGAQVARIVSTRDVKVVAGVPERFAGNINVGDPVQVRLQAYGSEQRTGRITFVGSAVNPQTRTFPIEVSLPNSSGMLKPSMVATVLVRREQIADAIVVPRAAIVREADGEIVYVVEGGEAAARTVTTGSSYGERIVVTSGLSAGDELIVLGQNNVAPGDQVDVAEQRRTIGSAADRTDLVAPPTE